MANRWKVQALEDEQIRNSDQLDNDTAEQRIMRQLEEHLAGNM